MLEVEVQPWSKVALPFPRYPGWDVLQPPAGYGKWLAGSSTCVQCIAWGSSTSMQPSISWSPINCLTSTTPMGLKAQPATSTILWARSRYHHLASTLLGLAATPAAREKHSFPDICAWDAGWNLPSSSRHPEQGRTSQPCVGRWSRVLDELFLQDRLMLPFAHHSKPAGSPCLTTGCLVTVWSYEHRLHLPKKSYLWFPDLKFQSPAPPVVMWSNFACILLVQISLYLRLIIASHNHMTLIYNVFFAGHWHLRPASNKKYHPLAKMGSLNNCCKKTPVKSNIVTG